MTARWHAQLAGAGPGEKTHWRTKTAYYDAVDRVLATAPAGPVTWKTIVDAVRPQGSRSTFYEVTGPRAKYPLIAVLRAGDGVDTAQLTLRYTRTTPVDQLVDETKVHRYWPYRTAWLRGYQREPDLAANALLESLVSVVAEWARCHRALAAALDHAPPVCAVEDLLAVCRGRMSAVCAHGILVKVVRHALHAPDDLDPIDAVRTDLGLAGRRVSSPDALVVGIAEQIYALTRETQRLGPREAVAAWRLAADLMRNAVAAAA